MAYEHHIYRAIKAGRHLNGQTMTDLASATGLSYNRIRYIESGTKSVSVDELMMIAKAQDLDMDFYLYGPGGTVVPRNYDNPGYLSWDQEIIVGLDELVASAA